MGREPPCRRKTCSGSCGDASLVSSQNNESNGCRQTEYARGAGEPLQTFTSWDILNRHSVRLRWCLARYGPHDSSMPPYCNCRGICVSTRGWPRLLRVDGGCKRRGVIPYANTACSIRIFMITVIKVINKTTESFQSIRDIFYKAVLFREKHRVSDVAAF